MRHLIEPMDFTVDELNKLFDLAGEIESHPLHYGDRMKGKIMATLFFEPSTRTRLSFETAMLRLGGRVIGFDQPSTSSVSKGETLADTVKIVSGYSDITVIRHPVEGAAKAASLYADCPIINAGDGGHQHPTQTLTDLYTIKKVKGRLSNLKVGFCGDLLNGRTVHSLISALARYKDIEFVFIAPKELELEESFKNSELTEKGFKYQEFTKLEDAMSDLDILYMTRVQGERFADKEQYERLKDCYILDEQKMKLAKDDMIVLHPLPRVNEIATEVDSDPRAYYFKQAKNGMYARMALIMTLDNMLNEKMPQDKIDDKQFKCTNPKCISNKEGYLPNLNEKTGDETRCIYCDRIE